MAKGKGNALHRVTEARALEVMQAAAIYGDAYACGAFKLSQDTLRRYRHLYPNPRLEALAELNGKTTDEELKLLAKAGGSARAQRVAVTDFRGEVYAFGLVTDLHMGSHDFDPGWWLSAVKELRRQKVETLYIAGDLTEGMSSRPGHVYELTHIGYKAQKAYAIEQLKAWDGLVYAIDGNHDRWFQKSNGAAMVEDICEHGGGRWTFLGQDEGKHLVNGVDLRLFHGEDGASYALSYRVQKLVDGYTGGEKPRVLLLGHDHKAEHLPAYRNVACFSGGTLQHQTRWMRGKRIAAHPGFWRISLVIKDKEVRQVTGTFYPFY